MVIVIVKTLVAPAPPVNYIVRQVQVALVRQVAQLIPAAQAAQVAQA